MANFKILFKHILTVAFYFLIISATAQFNSDTINKKVNAQKAGYWLYFFTDILVPTKDTNEACYYAYLYYDNGYSWDGFYCGSSSAYRKSAIKVEREGEQGKKGAPALLNGRFKYYDKRGNLIRDESYTNGFPGYFVDYTFSKKGVFKGKTIIDNSKKHKGQLCSFYMEVYTEKNELKENFFFGKNNKEKWGVIK